MKLLIAEQDRDFPAAFCPLLALHGHETAAVYDGTQVLARLAAEKWDAALLDDSLPRISHTELVAEFKKRSVPVIVLTAERLSTVLLTRKELANAYLSLPFLPDELTALLDRIDRLRKTEKRLVFGDAEISPSEFTLCGTLPVTAGEIEVFSSVLEKKPVNGRQAGAYVYSLNAKLEKLNKKTRIRYLINEGYRLVRI